MGARIFLALLVLVGLMWFFGAYGKMPPEKRKKFLTQAVIYGGIGLLLLLALTGRLPWFIALIGAMVPAIQRLLTVSHLFQNLRHGSLFDAFQGQVHSRPSQVETAFLRMILNTASGEMDGEILQGTHQGIALNSLEQDALAELYTEYCRIDQQSAALLEAYLDRRFDDAWRQADDHGRAPGSRGTAPMDCPQAAQILGIAEDADNKTVTRAHRQLISKLHPDRGGSDYLAALINEAKEILLKKNN